ncbi:hypothetical protein QEG73_04910 [Chitinophagaceae bacterium 26-R-25]|nr:hypothetical protein [Chitinophagaceae bacterium 26-R-25]
MSWSLLGADKIDLQFREAFTEKYTLLIDTHIQAGNMPIKTKTELRWQLSVEKIDKECITLELITLDNRLLESNNPMVKDLAAMSQAFGQMYNELHLVMQPNGRISKVLNLDVIQKKWHAIKKEMEQIQMQNESIKNVIKLNDELFTTPQKIIAAIEGNEFFMLYFHHIFGLKIPATTQTYTQRTLLNTANLEWRYKVKPQNQYYPGENWLINIEGSKETYIDKAWVAAAYKDFSHLNLKEVKPVFKDEGDYKIVRKTGMLLEATRQKQEVVHPELLHATIKYHMISDTMAKLKKKENVPPPSHQPPVQKQGGFNVIMDEWEIK